MTRPKTSARRCRPPICCRALANPHRLKILKLLDQAPHNVMDLCERLSLRQSLASQHLARLRIDGIVTAERQGHHVVYSLQNARAREILAILDGGTARPVKAKPRKSAHKWQRSAGKWPRHTVNGAKAGLFAGFAQLRSHR